MDADLPFFAGGTEFFNLLGNGLLLPSEPLDLRLFLAHGYFLKQCEIRLVELVDLLCVGSNSSLVVKPIVNADTLLLLEAILQAVGLLIVETIQGHLGFLILGFVSTLRVVHLH